MLETWLWLTVPAMILATYGCPIQSAWKFCSRFSNTVGVAFILFPAPLSWLFMELGVAANIALVALAAAVCHLGIRRLLPKRIGVAYFALLAAAWAVLSWVVEASAIGLMFGVPPWTLFHAMITGR